MKTDEEILRDWVNFCWRLRQMIIEIYPPYAEVAKPFPIAPFPEPED